jgi:hypothetical protein
MQYKGREIPERFFTNQIGLTPEQFLQFNEDNRDFLLCQFGYIPISELPVGLRRLGYQVYTPLEEDHIVDGLLRDLPMASATPEITPVADDVAHAVPAGRHADSSQSTGAINGQGVSHALAFGSFGPVEPAIQPQPNVPTLSASECEALLDLKRRYEEQVAMNQQLYHQLASLQLRATPMDVDPVQPTRHADATLTGIARARLSKMPAFDGKPGRTFNTFYDEFKIHAVNAKVAEPEWPGLLFSLLAGDALTFARSLLNGSSVSDFNLSRLVDGMMNSRFAIDMNAHQVMLKMVYMQFNGKTLKQFLNEKDQLVALIPQVGGVVQATLAMAGLPKRILDRVIRNPVVQGGEWQSYDEFRAFCMSVENDLSPGNAVVEKHVHFQEVTHNKKQKFHHYNFNSNQSGGHRPAHNGGGGGQNGRGQHQNGGGKPHQDAHNSGGQNSNGNGNGNAHGKGHWKGKRSH